MEDRGLRSSILDPQFLLRKRKRWIFPVTVLGRSSTNSTQRGYLYGANLFFTWFCNSSRSSALGLNSLLSKTNAFGLSKPSASVSPITPDSSTAGCSIRVFSISIGETQRPPTFIMLSERPEYQ